MAGISCSKRLISAFRSTRNLCRFSTVLPNKVRLVEVGPRDGLQNESRAVSLETKLSLIEKLAASGISHIEAGAFVSPKLIPQMAESEKILQHLCRLSKNSSQSKALTARPLYSFLVPNLKGLGRAFAAAESWRPGGDPLGSFAIDEVAVFASASETFSQRNINCSITESLQRFEPVIEAAKKENIRVRAYVSMVLGCPYEGQNISPQSAADVAKQLWNMGADEISLGDTIGTGTPERTCVLLDHVHQSGLPKGAIAMHFHDTYHAALANIKASLGEGIRIFDSSVGGLGGCPFAKGATGNVATEDVIRLLNSMGYQCGVDLDSIENTAAWIRRELSASSP